MKAVLFHGPKDLRYEEIDPYKLLNGEILIKIEAALTGGTDVKTYLHGHPRIIKKTPSTFGYEFAGIVEEIGPDYDSTTLAKIKKGMRVVAANTAPCFNCFYCEKKEYSLCENLNFLNGSFAQFIKIPAQIVKYNLYEIPEGLDFKEAAMVQTLAVCLHGFFRSQIKPGDTVAVYGLGAIGQTFIKILKAYNDGLLDEYFAGENVYKNRNDDENDSSVKNNAYRKQSGFEENKNLEKNIKIIGIGRSVNKQKLAIENGADFIIDLSDLNKTHSDTGLCDINKIKNAQEKNLCEMIEQLSPYGADVVIEAVGKPEVWQQCFDLVRRGGLINFFGGCPKGTKIEVDTFKLHYDEIRTIGVFHHTPQYIKMALDLIGSQKISMSNLITHEMDLSELEHALELMLKGDAIKVLIEA